ncbi:MAG: class I SAM-dependent methyltransferase [Oscillochloridaceae bacterium umkhey_bin13]
MPIYTTYAPIYDAIGQGAFATALVSHVLADLPAPPQRVLDLACGTGAAALALAAHGAAVVGLDRSPAMLRIAAGRARDRGLPITWIEANLRALPIGDAPGELRPGSFDLITCLYDSLNYLTGDGDLALVLRDAARLLAPGGRLVFDLNTEAEFLTWDESDQIVYDQEGLLVYNRLSYDPARRLARGRIVWFSSDGQRWWRDEETHHQRAWSEADVLAGLTAAGLRLRECRTPDWAEAGPNAPRVVYVAERSTAELAHA